MKFKLNYLFALVCLLATFTFTSCQDDDDVQPTSVVNCDDFTATIAEVDSSLVVTAMNGTEPITYEWSTGEVGNTLINAYAQDEVSVVVTDANGCTETVTFSNSGNNPCNDLTAQIYSDSLSNNLSVSVSGGTAPYTYEWSTGATTSSITTDGSGNYSVTVIDAEGCIVTVSYDGNPGGDPCDGFGAQIYQDSSSTNVLYASVYGGTAPYSYNWSDGSAANSISPTVDGVYTVIITDANGCTVTLSYNFNGGNNDPCSTFMTSIQMYQDSTSNAVHLYANTSGGASPYTWNWSTGEFSNDIIISNMGVYSVTATDANGCAAISTYQY